MQALGRRGTSTVKAYRVAEPGQAGEGACPFIEAARRVPRGGTRRGASRPGGSSADRAEVRAWARAAGLKVSGRGRSSSDIMRQYEAAH